MSRPSVLIANDDGIFSGGIYALWEAMSEIGDTTVVAPNTEKSAVGHAITLSDPIRIEKVKRSGGFQGYAVNGTPADSVKIAVKAIMDKKPDIIISGINVGANIGQSLLYSGTISAATEGTFLGIPSIAISLNSLKGGEWSGAKIVAQKVVQTVLDNNLPNGTLLNVNVPNIPESEFKGYKVTHQGSIYFKDSFEKREDPRGRLYYWMTGKIKNPDKDIKSDGVALKEGYVSITPLQLQMTNLDYMAELAEWEIG
ncbi:MAG: 5'/3'-nucleotidase SurE [Candidatus Marinimicrobia bacterium]|jgi:5'-nucleotidase|nr:5'/3'-nucleotidase SurE [Candidatus Neomarinimicrobiota bacterium]MDP6612111.1 5'/3'-nucleotidase SurE [Candidatus Neomarinimicrobiota bacterium]|tara:strand:+ start:11846 stop:12610 length:765 start_codon:yes stop_codon:yes gene_type:complete